MPSRGFLLALLAGSVLAYLGLNLLVRWIYPKQLFPYRGTSYPASADLHWADSRDGNRIAMIFRPAGDENAPLVLYFHGNGEDIGMNEDRFAWFNARGWAVLAADYPGYGLSSGEPTPGSVRAAAEAAAGYAVERLGISPERTLLWGRSLGGAPATHLAASRPYRGLVLESAFRSVLSLAPPVPLLLREPFPNETLLGESALPVRILHGRRDRVIPVSHAHALARAGGERATLHLFPDGGHNDLRFVGGDVMESILAGFHPTAGKD